jgi:diguanylate cyclase (GGDEF)-like protein/PAS domain S-box-containing protein
MSVRPPSIKRSFTPASHGALQAVWRALLDASFDGVHVVDPKGSLLYANARFYELLGYARTETLPTNLSAWEVDWSRDRQAQRFEELASNPGMYQTSYRCRDGSERLVEVSVRSVLLDGQLVFVCAARDHTERVRSERALEASVKQLEAQQEQLRLAAEVFRSTDQGIVVTQRDGTIVEVNGAFERMTGYSREEAVGQNPRILKSGRHDATFYQGMWRSLLEKGGWEGELWNRRKSGELYGELLTISSVRGADGQVERFVGVFSDVTDRKRNDERMQRLAERDPLTGLPNRSVFRDRLSVAMARARRERARVAVLFVDLDHFKEVNDTMGHEAGDRLLEELARRLVALVRESDTVSRQGGDEFVLLLGDLVDPGAAARVAEGIIADLGAPVRIAGREVSVTASVGIALFPDNAEELDELLRNADTAMYAAKTAGRNCFQFFSTDMNERAFEQRTLVRSLKRALAVGQLRLLYQPRFALPSRELVGVEALVRWEHPTRGFLAPDQFLPHAEDSSLSPAVDAWVLGAVGAQLHAWREQGRRIVPVSMNVTTKHFRRPDFVKSTLAVLHDESVDPSQVELELRESALASDVDEVHHRLSELSAAGLRVCIDGYGSGSSCLSDLERFPLHRLDLDGSFVRQLGRSARAERVVRAAISTGRILGLRTLGENVETARQAELLVEMGCDEAQGRYFAGELTADELATHLG